MMAVIDLGKNNPNRQMQKQPAQGQQPMQMNIDLKNCEDIKCTSCQSEFFVDITKLKYISPLQSPTGKDTIAAVVIGKVCNKCGEIFNPEIWKRQRQANFIKEESKEE
jgi:hypothetical protein